MIDPFRNKMISVGESGKVGEMDCGDCSVSCLRSPDSDNVPPFVLPHRTSIHHSFQLPPPVTLSPYSLTARVDKALSPLNVLWC